LRVGFGIGDLDVRLGAGDADVRLGAGDPDVRLGAGDAHVGLKVGEADVELRPGEGLTNASATPTAKNPRVPATTKPTLATRRMPATRRRLAAADPGRPNLVLKILASKVAVALHLHAAKRLKQTNVNNSR
jgi:hypothetical protein